MIDNIHPRGSFSCVIYKDNVKIRRAFVPSDNIQDVIDFTGNQEIIDQVKSIWTDEVVAAYKYEMLEQEAWDENYQRDVEKQDAARLEIQYAEEQAWIENTVRDLFK